MKKHKTTRIRYLPGKIIYGAFDVPLLKWDDNEFAKFVKSFKDLIAKYDRENTKSHCPVSVRAAAQKADENMGVKCRKAPTHVLSGSRPGRDSKRSNDRKI